MILAVGMGAFSQDQVGETIKCTIVQKKAYNKVGKEMPGEGDLYIKYQGKEVFIKLMSSKVTLDELTPHIGEKITLVVQFEEGLWDTDDPNIQSRIGEYAIVLELKE